MSKVSIKSSLFPTLQLSGWQRKRQDSIKISGSGTVTLASPITINAGAVAFKGTDIFGYEMNPPDSGYFVGEIWVGTGTAGELSSYGFFTMDDNGDIMLSVETGSGLTISTGDNVVFRFEL